MPLIGAAYEGCCGDDAWRGRHCSYHEGYEDGLAAADAASPRDVVSPKYEQVGWLWRYVPSLAEYNSIGAYAQWHWASLVNDPTESKRDEGDALDVEPVYRRRSDG